VDQLSTPAKELEFVFRSGRLCLSFTATVGERWRGSYERLNSAADLARWYREAALLGPDQHVGVTSQGLDKAKALREAIYRCAQARIAGRPTASSDEKLVNEFAEAPPLVPALDGTAVRLSLPRAAGELAVLSTIARDAIDLFGTEAAARIRECAHAECALLFVDTSRPGHRQWCSSATCGSKTRSAKYRERKASPVPSHVSRG
jgi:predicted RNA-binding Zn ribbon-like protein